MFSKGSPLHLTSSQTAFSVSVTWKKFYIHLAGCTDGAHLHIVDLLKQLNQSEVFSPEESDYIVVFCPVRSHIRNDISVALETVPGNHICVLLLFYL